jgi:hypothetical protein
MKTQKDMNDCGCCKGLSIQTPMEIFNRPGQKTLSRRVGTHSQFKQSMISALSALPEMKRLTTRGNDDFTIALLDSWATVADLLTFYQERIANESYLRTATERLSLQQLSRLIDYELRPGVAASTWLAFEMETAEGAPHSADIRRGTRAQSIPGQDEQPQTFETVEDIQAKPEWNSLRPRMTQPHPLARSIKCLALKGLATGLKTGDILIIAPNGIGESSDREIACVESVNLRSQDNVTEVWLVRDDITNTASDASNPPSYDKSSPPADISQYFQKSSLTRDFLKDLLKGRTFNQEDLISSALIRGWKIDDMAAIIAGINEEPSDTAEGKIFVLRQRAAIFGHNAPKCPNLPIGTTHAEMMVEKKFGASAPAANVAGIAPYSPPDIVEPPLKDSIVLPPDRIVPRYWIYLDNVYPTILEGSWVVLTSSNKQMFHKVLKTEEITKTQGALSLKVTGLLLSIDLWELPTNHKQMVEVLAQNEHLTLADVSIPNSVPDDVGGVTLDGFYPGLKAGMRVILSGQPKDQPGVIVSENLILNDALVENGYTKIIFKAPLPQYNYLRSSVKIYANVALATHGESSQEWLGSGDASLSFQSFKLRQSPITYVSSSSPSGAETTLAVRVNGLLWQEVSHLYDRCPKEHIYFTRSDESGKTIVQFGDGQIGARLPSGRDNVQASYRKGIGLAGLVKAGQIANLMTRPLGVKGVVNPLPSEGAEDPEALEDARRNAPLNVMTLGRIVSLQDYEDFARAFAGVAKALATWTWNGERRVVLLTVAGPKGLPIEEGSDLQIKLLEAMRSNGDPRIPLSVKSYTKASFRMNAEVKVDPSYQTEVVLAEVMSALRDRFSFEAREFGQPVTYDEVMAVMQEIPGVTAVNVTALYKWPLSDEQTKKLPKLPLDNPLPAKTPVEGRTEAEAAELLTLDSPPFDLEVMV